MGEAVAVKKSLISFSWRLLVKGEKDGAPKAYPYKAFPNSISSVALPQSAEKEGVIYSQEDGFQRLVVFRFLCSVDTSGGVIGKGAKVVKDLEKETRASITFSDYVVTQDERLVTISALEVPEPLFSPSKIAVVRVFARSIEVSNERCSQLGLEKGETITARLLLSSDKVGCLRDAEGKMSVDISTATEVQMQLLSWTQFGTHLTDKEYNILQIIGLYENVKRALFQVTGRLRNSLYSDIIFDGEETMENPYSANAIISRDESEKSGHPGSDLSSENSSSDHGMVLVQEMDRLGLLCKPVNGEYMMSVADTVGDLVGGGIEHQRPFDGVEPAPNSKVDFKIPEQVFDSVCSINGSNLARMEQISGASIKVEAPCPDEHFRVVIISGTLNRIKIARSLLQAFILPEL